jgi:ATP-dependent DNA helicase Rep
VLGQYAAERECSMFDALFESGFEPRIAARALAHLREFADFINRISHRATKEPASPLLSELLQAIDYEAHIKDGSDEKTATNKWQNVLDFLDWIKKRSEDDGVLGGGPQEASLLKLAQEMSLLSQLDRKDEQKDAVQLSTIHAAKGLEYPHVFIAGCEEGVLPHHRDLPGEEEESSPASGSSTLQLRVEEERRLMYVAVTRAQRGLQLSWCQKRKRGRDWFAAKPSRFIAEMQLPSSTASNKPLQQDAAKLKLDALKAMLAQRSASKTDQSS